MRKWNLETRSFEEVDYAGYKANRTAMPGDLAAATALYPPRSRRCGSPLLQLEGFEADDVIGTLAHQAAGEGSPGLCGFE